MSSDNTFNSIPVDFDWLELLASIFTAYVLAGALSSMNKLILILPSVFILIGFDDGSKVVTVFSGNPVIDAST